METDNIQRSLGQLEGTIREGFKAVNQRLDYINGSVKTHEKSIDSLKVEQAVLKTKAGFISSGFSLGVVLLYETLRRNFFK